MRDPRRDDPDLTLSDLLTRWPQTVTVFLRHGLLCVGCPIAPFHTITDACDEYNLAEDGFVAELRRAIQRGRAGLCRDPHFGLISLNNSKAE